MGRKSRSSQASWQRPAYVWHGHSWSSAVQPRPHQNTAAQAIIQGTDLQNILRGDLS